MTNDPERTKIDELAARIKQAEAPSVLAEAEAEVPLKFSRIGFDFMGTVLACTLLGWLADKGLGTEPWGLIAMILAGFAAGIWNVWRSLASPKQDG